MEEEDFREPLAHLMVEIRDYEHILWDTQLVVVFYDSMPVR